MPRTDLISQDFQGPPPGFARSRGARSTLPAFTSRMRAQGSAVTARALADPGHPPVPTAGLAQMQTLSLRRLLARLAARDPALPRIECWIESDEVHGCPDRLSDLFQHLLLTAVRARGTAHGPVWLTSDGGPPLLSIHFLPHQPGKPGYQGYKRATDHALRIDLLLARRLANQAGGVLTLAPTDGPLGSWARLDLPGAPGRADMHDYM